MIMSNTHVLQPLRDEQYAHAYAVFLKQWQLKRTASLAIMSRHLQVALADHPSLAVLSVGPGPGGFDQQVAHMVQQLVGDRLVRYVAVEPNPVHRQVFTATMQAAGFQNVHFDLLPIGIEELQTDAHFDCIHYTHSLYYMPGRERALILEALRMLTAEGFLLITIDSDDAVMPRMIGKYLKRTGNLGRQEFPLMIGAQYLMQLMDELGLAYEQTMLEESVDVTPCFDEYSQEGSALLDFLFHAQVSSSSPDLKKLSLAILAEEAVASGNRKLIYGPAATIVIPKQ
jgi:SAM-dependent methyltransferase